MIASSKTCTEADWLHAELVQQRPKMHGEAARRLELDEDVSWLDPTINDDLMKLNAEKCNNNYHM